MSRLGIFFVRTQKEITLLNANPFYKTLLAMADKIILVYADEDLGNRAVEKNVYTCINAAFFEEVCWKQYEEIIVITAGMIGPFSDICTLFSEKRLSDADFWGLLRLEDPYVAIGKLQKGYLFSGFLVMHKKACSCMENGIFQQFWKEVQRKEVSLDDEKYLSIALEKAGCLGEAAFDDREYQGRCLGDHFNPFLGKAYDLVVQKGILGLPMDIFWGKNLLTDSGGDAARVLKWMETNAPAAADYLYQMLLAEKDVYDIYTGLHLDYCVDSRYSVYPAEMVKNRAAVICHVYYMDLLPQIAVYLRQVPQTIDIYISTSREDLSLIEKILNDHGVDRLRMVRVENRGRDSSALYLGCREIAERYDYLCFVHDKKTSGGIGPCTIGENFMALIFDSLLSGGPGIMNILQLFEKNPRLGILSPPIPIHDGYFHLRRDAWCSDYEETKRTAEKLGLSIQVHKDKQPFVLSNAFWCRTAALAPLWRTPLRYEDYPNEPLPVDGVISHALERMIPYVAQSQGFFSGIVVNEEQASLHISNLEYVLHNVLRRIDEKKYDWSCFDCFMSWDMADLAAFCKGFRRIYLYGAGFHGKKYLEKLKKLDVAVAGFLVTDTSKGSKEIDGYCIWEWDAFAKAESKRFSEIGIIIAAMGGSQREIAANLERYGFQNYYVIHA